MARTSGPLMSSDAGGTYKDTLTFSIWKGRNYVRACQRPSNPKTVGQQANRLLLSQAVSTWNSQYQSSRDAWSLAARDVVPPMSGYNYFIGQFILQGAAPTIPAIAPKRKFTLHGDVHMTFEEVPIPDPYLPVGSNCVLYHAYWDGTALDHSSFGNHGTIVGATPVTNALRFDGNDYIIIPWHASLNPPRFTMIAWLNFASLAEETLFHTYPAMPNGQASDISIFVEGASTKFEIGFGPENSGHTERLTCPPPPSTGAWFHIACSFDSAGLMSIFYNGVSQASVTHNHDIVFSVSKYVPWFGRMKIYDLYLNADAGELRIFNTGLSVSDIQADFQATKARYGL